nr:hypothetical protein [Paeniclostridium sordellii]
MLAPTFTITSEEKLLKDSIGEIVEAVFATPFIIKRVFTSKAAVV